MLEIMLGVGGAAKRSYPNSGPGPITATGDENVGFFGEVANSEMFTAAELKNLIPELGSASIDATSNTGPWLKFYYYGRFLFIKKRHLFTSTAANGPTCWNQLYMAGLIHGVDGPGPTTSGFDTNQIRLVTKGNWKFKVETITADETATWSGGSSGYDNTVRRKSMWTELMYRVCSLIVGDGTIYPEKKFKNYPYTELGSSYEITREFVVNGSLFNNHLRHAGSTTIGLYGNAGRTVPYAWRPVLELTDPNQLYNLTIRSFVVSGGLFPVTYTPSIVDTDTAMLTQAQITHKNLSSPHLNSYQVTA